MAFCTQRWPATALHHGRNHSSRKRAATSMPTASSKNLGRRWSPVANLGVRRFDLVQAENVNPLIRAASFTATAAEASTTPRPGFNSEERRTIRIFQENGPSVVNVATTFPRLALFPLPRLASVRLGVGSGFVWDTKGHVVTNAHVVQGWSEVEVTLSDQRTFLARVVGLDRESDVAVLKLQMPVAEASALRPMELGSSSDLQVGQRVLAIGSPFGLDQTLTQGIVSALNREVPSSRVRRSGLRNAIQTDAAINPGNSGGPLLDSAGRLMGINTAIADPTGVGISSGVGFAIPVDLVRDRVEQLLVYGRVRRPALGIALAPLYARGNERRFGVLVSRVVRGSPADRAGIQPTKRILCGVKVPGDVIVALNGKEVKKEKDFFDALDVLRVGQSTDVLVERRSGTQVIRTTLHVTLEDRDKLYEL